jgi:hypothetical protein
MTASEFAFLALGLVLGVATGSALVMVLRAGPPAREIKLTVGHDAVPRRAATLSSDAFVTATAEPARGGPADRRRLDRDGSPDDLPTTLVGGGLAAPVMAPMGSTNRTSVSFAGSGSAAGGIPIVPERDPSLDELRVQAALTADHLVRAGMPTASTLLISRPSLPAPARPEPAQPAIGPATAPGSATGPAPVADVHDHPDADADVPALIRILRGDHRALAATAAILAGPDGAERQSWFVTLMSLVRGLTDRALREGWLDVPVGNPFWDTFTLEQCRSIAAALATAGYRFDGIDGWELGRVPAYRDLTAAVAGAGLEPRRIRAWPTQEEIADLYRQVTIATDDYVMTHVPDLDGIEIQAIVGGTGPELDRAWSAWSRVRSTLLEPVPLD